MRNFKLVSQNNIKEFLQKVTEEKQESCSCCDSNPNRYCRTGSYSYYDESDDISSRKLRGYKRRKAKEKFRGQRDNQPKNSFHRDDVHYTWESLNDHQESKAKLIHRGYLEYLDDIAEAEAVAKAEAEAEAEKEAFLRYLKKERVEALSLAISYFNRVFELDQAIAGLTGLEE